MFFEFHGMNSRDVQEQAELIQKQAAEHGEYSFRWKTNLEDMEQLWERAITLFCVQRSASRRRSSLNGCLRPDFAARRMYNETKSDLANLSVPRDDCRPRRSSGNFHVLRVVDPKTNPNLKRPLSFKRIVQQALRISGICTGEHGIGYGKIEIPARRIWRRGGTHADYQTTLGSR